MSIYGAMFSGVSGLYAQSQALGMISDNISNVNTVGYKGTQARFSTLVTRGASPNTYSPGGVNSQPFQSIDKQGLLQGSDSVTDLAVSGNGFFVVNGAINPGPGDSYLYTRAGSFKPGADGNLRNTAGYYLQGWRLNPDGSYVTGNQNVLNGLETVNISGLTGGVEATSEITFAGNLPGDATIVNPTPSTALTLGGNLTYNALGGGSATNTVTVFDNAGNPYEVTLNYVQTNPAAAGVITWDQVNVTQVTDASGAVVFAGPPANIGTLTYDEITGAHTGGTAATMDLTALTGLPGFTPMAVTATGTSSGAGATDITAAADGSANLANSSVQDDTYPMSVQIYDSLGVAYNVQLRYVKTGINAGPPPESNWDVYVASLQRVSDGSAVPGSPTDPDDPATWNGPIGSVSFGSNGLLSSSSAQPTPAVGAAIGFDLDLSTYTLTNGAEWGRGTPTIALNFGNAGQPSGMTQYSSDFSPEKNEQDGVQFGSFIGVSIDEMGIVTAMFDNGRSMKIFKLPLATFPNANGMEAVTGNAFLETAQSGSYFLREAGSGAAGDVLSGSLEASTVDLANEFTNMIVTQRAYSASAKIITTADEMLDELVRIKR